ncbi:MAG: type VI secretion system tip protein TssI/VgrG [Rubrivivax sp.]
MPDPSAAPLVTLKSPFGDKLLFRSMTALEEVSRLFEFEVLAVSEDPDLAVATVLNQNATVSMALDPDTRRHFSGLVTSFGIDGVDGRFYRYRLVLRPTLWLATRSSNIRIFQDKTAPEIVQAVLADTGVSAVRMSLSGTYPKRVYCVQYRESDFNFASRLLEDEGIFYFHEHAASGAPTLVLADTTDAFKVPPGYGTVHYREPGADTSEHAGIVDWQMRHEIQTGAVQTADFNFETPSTEIVANRKSPPAATVGQRYDAPIGAPTKARALALAQVRLDEQSARLTRYTAEGNDPTFGAGQRVTLANHPRDDQNAEYFVLQTQIDLEQAGYETGDAETRFLCRSVMQGAAQPFRPARLTRKPVVAGPQTAFVVGNTGKGKIQTDKYGRVKVQFHWDREGKKDDKSSCWLRVASGWAGEAWGMISLPRIGQEVVVGFLEGDPDQPLVVGRVYNAGQMPPYELPANAHISTMKSRSLGSANANKFNELRFSDELDKEYILLHAERDRLEFVEHDLKRHVMNESHETVDKNRLRHVKGNDHTVVGGNQLAKVTGDAMLKVDNNSSSKVAMKLSLQSGMDLTTKSGTGTSIEAGTDLHVKAGLNGALETGMALHLKGGMQVVVEAGLMMTLKAGPSSIVLGPDGISITGPIVKINSGGAPGSGNGATPVKPDDPKDATSATLPKDPL